VLYDHPTVEKYINLLESKIVEKNRGYLNIKVNSPRLELLINDE